MPVAVVIAAPGQIAPAALAVSLVCVLAILAYSLYKARRGDWGHIDASVPTERAQLNLRVSVGLLGAAGVLWLAGLHIGFPLVVGLSGLIVAVGHLFRRAAKLSLHVAFAVFAAFLAWPNHIAATALAMIAVGVAWSRIALRRHVASDIILGTLAGTSAGLAFHGVVALPT
jgi:membrane-associated phospholipid phosphatase